MPDSANDLACFFNADDGFTVSATIKGKPVPCHLDEGYEEEVETEGYCPEVHVLTSDLPSGLVDGDSVVIGSRTFKVRPIRPDISTTVTVLQLEYVSG